MTTQFRKSPNAQSGINNGYSDRLKDFAKAVDEDITQTSPPASRERFHCLSRSDQLPVRRKALLALIASQVFSTVGLMAASSIPLIWAGRMYLKQQAQSELSLSEQAYQLELDQLAANIRAEASHPALMAAARDYEASRPLSPEQERAVRDQLKQVMAARGIQYLTLVGTDKRTIASTNAERSGTAFDPDGLISRVLANPQELKTTAVVSPQQSLPLANQNGLIRYAVVPMRDPETQAVLAVLLAGDVLNQERGIETRIEFDQGYSAIYARQPNGFDLVTSTLSGGQMPEGASTALVPLPDTTLLEAATSAPAGETSTPVSQRSEIAGRPHMLVAKAISDGKGNPVAVLIHGKSEAPLLQLLKLILGLQLAVGAVLLLLNLLLAKWLGKSLVKPVENLYSIVLQFIQGNRNVRAEVYAQDEIGELTLAFNRLAESIDQSEALLQEQHDSQQQETEHARLLTAVMIQIQQSQDIEAILNTAVTGGRSLLQVDRVVIYRFNTDFTSGEIAAESIGEGWIKALGKTIYDPLNPISLERYRSGRISMVENLAEASLSRCHCEILERLEVQANIVAPILVGEQLLGLLCAHQCSGPRRWQPADVELMQQLSTQVGYALNQATLLHQQQMIAERERLLNQAVSKMRETLEPQEIFNTVLQDTRQSLAADRTVVYLFNQNWEGTIVAESVADDYLAALGAQIADPCFADKYVEKYRKGRVQATSNIRQANLTECHINQLEAFQVKANLVAPVLVKGKLLGLLIAHQCSAPRQWQEADIRFMRQIAIQLGFALEQANLFSQKEQARLEAEALSEQRQQQKELLQQQIVNLLGHVEGAAGGDLTVRAEVTAGELGTVADFFNAIIESLRHIVTQVKQSAMQVNTALGQNEDAVQRLADEAQQQAEETTRMLTAVEQMTASIQAVAQSAQQAAQVARTASVTAETGGNAMDLTVHNILSLRETIGDTAKKVKRLGESSQQISRVVSLINQIALQTNLLAINAGIEAARAGEEGQGFAVVAEEVGDLAARSAEATQEIEKVVAAIQRETSQVVESMEQSTVQVVEGTRLVEAAKRSLQEIVEVSRQIDQLVQSISAATVSQVATSEAVSQVMQQMTQVAERTSDSSRQVSTAIQQTVAIAQELQQSVEAFNVS
ncbi:GAF domain-containing protein [Leptolyngbya sp. NK1-12]|uniref:GAF domain-containing protein n=1 Tax=Leptolyngbya sp. NK1-12 TaxID=2547451 RepID=A0AA97AGJ1_9CYAN|nr:GAF domain-containing protein [Leptolyngbya sp. NK1-12]